MAIFQLFAGASGLLISSAAVFTVLLMMLLMSLRLQRANRKQRAYRFLNLGLLLAMIYQIMTMAAASSDGSGSSARIAADALHLLSFIIINFVTLELYSRPTRLDRGIMISLLLLTSGVSAFQLLPVWNPAITPNGGMALYQAPFLHFFGILIDGLFLATIAPRVGQRANYTAGLSVYMLSLLLQITAYFSGPDIPAALSAALLLLPLCYYMLLFWLIFDWVIERLQSVYGHSIRDGLTGLYNRQHFMKRAQRYKSRGLDVYMLFCDIDDFKRLNDRQGHHAADEVLKLVSAIITGETKGFGTAGRFGGEELVAAIAHPKAKASAIAEAIRKKVERDTPVTVSIGWSVSGRGISLEEAIKQADEAMYRSKTSGKNKVTPFRSPGRSKSASKAEELTRDLSDI
jgi:diguanylate cyclase (GGDEF)-like protein